MLRLYAGSINSYPDEEGWRNFILDASPRPVWDRDLNMGVQPHFVGDIANLVDFRDELFDEVVASHVLEHLPPDRAAMALAEFHRVLKVGGTLRLELPDLAGICAAYTSGEIDHRVACQWLFGEQLPHHQFTDSHRSGWTPVLLEQALADAGFDPGANLGGGLEMRYTATKING